MKSFPNGMRKKAAKAGGMFVSLLDIKVAYMAVFDKAMPMDMPFVDAGNAVKDAFPSNFDKVFEAVNRANKANEAIYDYDKMAADAKLALREAGLID